MALKFEEKRGGRKRWVTSALVVVNGRGKRGSIVTILLPSHALEGHVMF